MRSESLKFLRTLVDTPGPVGHEGPVVAKWLEYNKPFADETYTDSYGNGFAVVNPKGAPTVMLTGHADEIGLMVSNIDENGFLWVASLGGYDAKILPAMRVKVLAKGGTLPGVIGSMPPHLQRETQGGEPLKLYKFGQNVYVDIGAKDQIEAEKYVRVGDPIILDYGYLELGLDIAVGRGFDNKIGIWAAAEGLRIASESPSKLNAKVVAVATVQEEIGGHGAAMSAFSSDPDVALVVDVTQSVDHPNVDKRQWGDAKMGKGPVIAHGSACHPVVIERLEKLARRRRIPLQHEAAPRYTGTDADSIFIAKSGIPTAVVSLPQRYMHSPAEMVNLEDLQQIAELLGAFALDLNKRARFSVVV